MIEIIISKLQHKVLSLIILVFISLILRQTLIVSKQYWAKSFSHTSTFILLPIITYCIIGICTLFIHYMYVNTVYTVLYTVYFDICILRIICILYIHDMI